MNPLVKEIRTEFSQWGLLVVDTEYDECPRGTMLAVTEMPGDETLCRVSLIGPTGRYTAVYNTLALLAELIQLPRCEFADAIVILQNKLKPMRENVTKDGALMSSNLPEHLRGVSNGKRIRHIC